MDGGSWPTEQASSRNPTPPSPGSRLLPHLHPTNSNLNLQLPLEFTPRPIATIRLISAPFLSALSFAYVLTSPAFAFALCVVGLLPPALPPFFLALALPHALSLFALVFCPLNRRSVSARFRVRFRHFEVTP